MTGGDDLNPKPLASVTKQTDTSYSTKPNGFKLGFSLGSLSSIYMKRLAKYSRYYVPAAIFLIGALAGGLSGAWLEGHSTVVSGIGGLSSQQKIVSSQS